MRLCASAFALASLITVVASGQQPGAGAWNGTWEATTDAPAALRPAPSPILGARFGLEVTATHAVIRRTIRGETSELALPLDGTTATYRAAARPCEGDQEFHEQVRLEDGALVLSRLGSIPAGGGTLRPASVRIRLRPGDGETLVVEGQMAQREGGPVAVGTVYRKATTAMPDPPAPPPVKLAATSIGVLSWLPGTWGGLNGATTFEERWTPIASGSMQGLGRTLRADTQTGFEFFCISERAGGLVYTAWPNARPTPTHFYSTEVSADMVKFENPAHDFPQVIIYTRMPDGALRTTISRTDGSSAQHFTLKKQ